LKGQHNIIFTNGCFDLLHSAHVTLFQFCKELAGPTGVVVVGLNSDASIRRLKGEQRPIYTLQDRVAMLEAFDAVYVIVPFEEDTPYDLIRQIRPHILVKGGDYAIEDIVGREFAKEVVRFQFIEGKSTTHTIQRCHDRNSSKE
jgi:D-beta-D-heptose 7-phosphate kinase/D-beta-D-heptose 1-phosphate adenosyltransferase